jgi:hypothetical protein
VVAVQQSAVVAATAKNSTPVPAQPEALNRTEPVEVAELAEATDATDAGLSAPAGTDIAMKAAAEEPADATGTAAIAEKRSAGPPAASEQAASQPAEMIVADHGIAAPAGTFGAPYDAPNVAREAVGQGNTTTKSAEPGKTANRRASRGLFSRLLGGGGDPAATAKDVDAPPTSAKSSTPSGESETTTNRRGLRGLFNRVLGSDADKAVPANEVAIDKANQGIVASGRPSR